MSCASGSGTVGKVEVVVGAVTVAVTGLGGGAVAPVGVLIAAVTGDGPVDGRGGVGGVATATGT